MCRSPEIIRGNRKGYRLPLLLIFTVICVRGGDRGVAIVYGPNLMEKVFQLLQDDMPSTE